MNCLVNWLDLSLCKKSLDALDIASVNVNGAVKSACALAGFVLEQVLTH